MFRQIFYLSLLLCVPAFARVELLFAMPYGGETSANCARFILFSVEDFDFYEGIEPDNQIDKVILTRKQIYDTYRQLGTVPEWEIEELMREDEKFPASAVLYLRSVNSRTGKVEGIMRIVSGELPFSTYYNQRYASVMPGAPTAELPIYHKYEDAGFRAWLKKQFPLAHEFGRAVYAEGVNEHRVLNDMVVAAIFMCHLFDDRRDHFIVAEAVRAAIPRYEAMGMLQIPSPIPLNDGRVIMALPSRQAFDNYYANARILFNRFNGISRLDLEARRALLPEFDAIISGVSPRRAISDNYAFGLYHRVLAHYAVNDFAGMLPDIRRLERIQAYPLLTRGAELSAEVGTRFNFVTGTGDLQAALAFLDSAGAQQRYADENLPRCPYPHTLLFMKGLVYLGAGQYAEARKIRLELEERLRQKIASERLAGRGYAIVFPEWEAAQRVVDLKEALFDPETGVGDPVRAYMYVSDIEHDNAIGVTSTYHAYRAQVLAAMGRTEEAAKSRAIADALR